MSISDKLAQLTSIRTAIRTALTAKGVTDAGTHNYADFAEDIESIQTGSSELWENITRFEKHSKAQSLQTMSFLTLQMQTQF